EHGPLLFGQDDAFGGEALELRDGQQANGEQRHAHERQHQPRTQAVHALTSSRGRRPRGAIPAVSPVSATSLKPSPLTVWRTSRAPQRLSLARTFLMCESSVRSRMSLSGSALSMSSPRLNTRFGAVAN